MSSLGTGPAAGVAQTSHQAQQVGRTQARRRQQQVDQARRVREVFEVHLRALDEGEEEQNASQTRVDGDRSDQHQPPDASTRAHRHSDASAADASEGPNPARGPSDRPDDPLYQHVDVKV